jgi:hypothetical protein
MANNTPSCKLLRPSALLTCTLMEALSSHWQTGAVCMRQWGRWCVCVRVCMWQAHVFAMETLGEDEVRANSTLTLGSHRHRPADGSATHARAVAYAYPKRTWKQAQHEHVRYEAAGTHQIEASEATAKTKGAGGCERGRGAYAGTGWP